MRISVFFFLLVAVACGQSRLTSPVIIYPPGGSTSAQIWMREPITSGTDQIKIRIPALPASYDIVLPTAPASGGDCLKQSVTSSTVLTLVLGACGGASDWQVVSGNLTPVIPANPVQFRQWTIEDVGGGGLTWTALGDIGNPAIATNRFTFYDNASQPVLEMQRTFLGTTTNNMIVDMNIIPRTDGTRSLGGVSSRYAFGHINELRSNFLTPPVGVVEVNGDIVVTTGNTVGLSTNRIPKIWVQDFDCSGVGCPGGASVWSRNAGLGYLEPTTTTDDVWVRKLVVKDIAGSGLFWDLIGEIGNPTSQTNRVFLRDGSGVKVIEFERTLLGSASNIARLDMSFEPLTDGIRHLGSLTRRWEQAHLNKVYTTLLTPGAGSSIEIDGSLLPTSAASTSAGVGNATNPFNVGVIRNLYTFALVPVSGTEIAWFNNLVPNVSGGNLGSLTNRVGTVFTTNIDCSGGACPSSKWTDGGVTTYLTATFDNVAIGLTSTVFKFEVAGSSKLDGDLRLGGDFFCVFDAACDIGDNGFGTVARPAQGHFATAVYTYDGGGSSTIRTRLSGSGVAVFDSGGTQVASINGITGRISSNIGFTVNGVNGVTGTTAGGCVLAGGIITNAACLP